MKKWQETDNYLKANMHNSIKLIIKIVFLIIIITIVSVLLLYKQAIRSDSYNLHTQNESKIDLTIPDYSGEDYFIINNNVPYFTDDDILTITGEKYSDLDILGRCGTAIALLSKEMMPTKKREGIGQVKPSGWVQKKYEGYVDSNPPYLYNRCHLIAYGLTGQNANELNLITGTRYFNVELMLPYEEKVMRYLDNSGNHVLYRITPYFKDNELVARGVIMEAYSIEDKGNGICFNIFVYNHQPGIKINYLTGNSSLIK